MRLVVPSDRDGVEEVGAFGRIHHVRAPRAPIHPEYRILYPQTYLLRGSPIRRILRDEQPHVVEVNDKYTLPYLAGLLRIGRIAEMARRPAVVGLSCERMDQTLRAYSRVHGFSRALLKCVYFPQFDHHIAVSRNMAEELEIASRGHKVACGFVGWAWIQRGSRRSGGLRRPGGHCWKERAAGRRCCCTRGVWLRRRISGYCSIRWNGCPVLTGC